MQAPGGQSAEIDSSDLDACTDRDLDDALRRTELELRSLAARRALLLGAVDRRGSHRADGHRSIPAYVRAHCNTSTGTTRRDHALARLVATHPTVADTLGAGRISIDHAAEIVRFHANPRIRHLLEAVLPTLLDSAEHTSHAEFRTQIDTLITLADTDGAHRHLDRAIEGRSAWVDDLGGLAHVTASGGDPVTAAQLHAIFEAFVEGELRADLEQRRAEHGDAAEEHPLPRTPPQRRFDALVAIFAAAAASPDGRALPEPTVDILIDQATAHDAFTHVGLTLPNGQQIDLDPDDDHTGLLTDLTRRLTADPDTLTDRTCRLATGAAIHPLVALRAMLTSHIRRVVVDSRSTVIDFGTRRRLFTGAARDAALLLATTCTHPGCTVPAHRSQVDHLREWADTPDTSQANAQARCGPHNRFKHRQRWRTRRDDRGRTYDQRPDDTIVLPIGERPPDLTRDQLDHHARRRVHALRRPE